MGQIWYLISHKNLGPFKGIRLRILGLRNPKGLVNIYVFYENGRRQRREILQA